MIVRSNRKRIGKVIILLACISVVWIIGRAFTNLKHTVVVSPIPEVIKPKQSLFSFFQKKKNPNDLIDKVNNMINNSWSDYSVYIEDYNSDFSMGISETETFTAASVNKVPILAALYFESQKGDVNLDKVITLQQDEIQDYGTGSIRYDSPGTTYSVKTLARLMIKQSDNTAAYILANEIIGFDKVQAHINQWGLTQTDMANNKTSNKDIAMLFRKIYEEKVANHAYTQEMLSFFKNTDYETRLPANLPAGVTVYHKVGSDVGAIHDVGIVTDGKNTYYIGIFTNDETDDASTEQLIAKISRMVYDYMKS